MSYVQGTKIRVIGEFRNPDTDALEDPPDVVVSIWPPDELAPTIERRYSTADGISKLGVGRYQTVLDTSPAWGEWKCLFESTGPDAVAKMHRLRVRARPPVVA